MEVILSIWRVKAFDPGGNQATGIGIGIAKVENSGDVEVNRLGKRQREKRNEGKDDEYTGLGSHG